MSRFPAVLLAVVIPFCISGPQAEAFADTGLGGPLKNAGCEKATDPTPSGNGWPAPEVSANLKPGETRQPRPHRGRAGRIPSEYGSIADRSAPQWGQKEGGFASRWTSPQTVHRKAVADGTAMVSLLRTHPRGKRRFGVSTGPS